MTSPKWMVSQDISPKNYQSMAGRMKTVSTAMVKSEE